LPRQIGQGNVAPGGEEPLAATNSAAERGEATMTCTFSDTRLIDLRDLAADRDDGAE
jgi:hypothetical protein